MNPSEIPEKPLYANVNLKREQPERIYFFERENGSIIFAKENEAHRIYRKRNQVIGQERERIKFLGSSDGQLFYKAVEESKVIFQEKGLEAAQERIRQGEKEELEVARGQMIYPRNMDVVDRGHNPINLQNYGNI